MEKASGNQYTKVLLPQGGKSKIAQLSDMGITSQQAQINEYAGLKIKAEMELGRRTAEMEKASGGDRKSSKYQNPTPGDFDRNNTKATQLSDMGITSQQAQINEYAGLKIKAEMELGRRTAEMEKARNQWENARPQCGQAKTSQLSDIGLTRQQASRYETLKEEKKNEIYPLG